MKRYTRARTRAVQLIVLVFVALSCSLPARAANTTYTYDALGRLTTVTNSANGAIATYAYDAAGNRVQTTSKAESIPPSVPTGLGATAVSGTQINLSWSASTDTGGSGLAGYRIYRGGTLIATSTTTSYANTSLTNATTYIYRVAAYDAAGNASAQSSPASATTQDMTPPSTPANLSATAASPSRINLSWGASTDTGGSGLAGYRVYRNGALIASTTATSYGDTGLASSTNYPYTVLAYDNAGNSSAPSNGASATTWPPVVASLSTNAWKWIKRGANAPKIDPPVVCAGSGGSGSGYSYAWQWVSGDTQTSAISPASSSTRWHREMDAFNQTYTSIWRCLVTDSGGNTGQSTVTVSFTMHTLQ